MIAQGIVGAIGDIKSQIGGEKKIGDAEKGETSKATEKRPGAIGNLFGKKDKVVPPPIPTVGYYVAIDGKQKGPYDISALVKMKEKGTFTSDTLVWKEGMENWIRAEEVEEVSKLFKASTPPPLP